METDGREREGIIGRADVDDEDDDDEDEDEEEGEIEGLSEEKTEEEDDAEERPERLLKANGNVGGEERPRSE